MDLHETWVALPAGARAALDGQWAGVAAGGLPCGAAVTVADASDVVLSRGRNRAHDEPTGQDALERTALAHAELNALARVPVGRDPAELVLWSTQHPCPMCAAACAFIGVGQVRFLAHDPSADGRPEEIAATRGSVTYVSAGTPLVSAVATVLFLSTGAAISGERDRNLSDHRDEWPRLTSLVLRLTADDALGRTARAGAPLPDALAAHQELLREAANELDRSAGAS